MNIEICTYYAEPASSLEIQENKISLEMPISEERPSTYELWHTPTVTDKAFATLAQKIIDQNHEIYSLKKELEKWQWKNQ